MSLLLPDAGLLFWMLLAFLVVFFILAKYGFPVVTKMVEERKKYIDKSLAAANQANEQLADIKVNSEKILAEAREQQTKILNNAQSIHDKIIEDAKLEAQIVGKKQLDEVRQQIEAEKVEAIQSVRREIAGLVVDVAGKVLRQKLEKDDAQMKTIDRMLQEVENQKS
jgi:F-type H+-transporting ATPase subunit b